MRCCALCGACRAPCCSRLLVSCVPVHRGRQSTRQPRLSSDAVTIAGELRDYPSTADSGRRMHWRFCPTCGVHVFSQAEERPHLVVVRAGTLDDPEIAVAQALIGQLLHRVGRTSIQTCRKAACARRDEVWLAPPLPCRSTSLPRRGDTSAQPYSSGLLGYR